MRALAGERSPHPGGDHPSVSPLQVPPLGGLGRGAERDPEELGAVPGEYVAGPPPPLRSEVGVVGGEDHTAIGEAAQIPRRGVVGDERRLAVAGGNSDQQDLRSVATLRLGAGDRLDECFVDQLEMGGELKLAVSRQRQPRGAYLGERGPLVGESHGVPF
jgi:hypothetical protein